MPQGAVAGDWTAEDPALQHASPMSPGDMLTEARMWGVTPLDQLWCRIEFKQARYEGQFTPPGRSNAIFYPGSAGGVNWGSVTVDRGARPAGDQQPVHGRHRPAAARDEVNSMR